ncbi:hypothetical protein SGRIM128S_05793 [Streptomyces griseomycini]
MPCARSRPTGEAAFLDAAVQVACLRVTGLRKVQARGDAPEFRLLAAQGDRVVQERVAR